MKSFGLSELVLRKRLKGGSSTTRKVFTMMRLQASSFYTVVLLQGVIINSQDSGGYGSRAHRDNARMEESIVLIIKWNMNHAMVFISVSSTLRNDVRIFNGDVMGIKHSQPFIVGGSLLKRPSFFDV